MLTRLTPAAVTAALACLLATVFGLNLGVRASTAGAASSEPSIGVIRLCSGCAGIGDHSKYQYVFLNAGDYGRIAGLRSANPGIKILVYKDMSSTRSSSCGGLISAGVDYCDANVNHPDWFTHKSGARFEWSGFSSHWQMNIGLKAYQDKWAANVLSNMKQYGWDGVVVDNANMDPSGYKALPYDEYPTRRATRPRREASSPMSDQLS